MTSSAKNGGGGDKTPQHIKPEENKLQQDVRTRGSPSQPPFGQTEHVTKGSSNAQEHHGRSANPTTDDDSPPNWAGEQ